MSTIPEIEPAQLMREATFRDGYRAARAGGSRDDNPYLTMPRSTHIDEWRACWDWGFTTGAQRHG